MQALLVEGGLQAIAVRCRGGPARWLLRHRRNVAPRDGDRAAAPLADARDRPTERREARQLQLRASARHGRPQLGRRTAGSVQPAAAGRLARQKLAQKLRARRLARLRRARAREDDGREG
eukprot:3520089-Prymnesium_polylepis.1